MPSQSLVSVPQRLATDNRMGELGSTDRDNTLRPYAAGVTIGARHLLQIANVDRMLKHARARDHLLGVFALCQDRMAGIAVLRNGLAFGAYVLPIVTAEAATGIEVPNVIGVRLPV